MEFTLNGVRTYNGEQVKAELKFARRDDGTWYLSDFGEELKKMGKEVTAQFSGWDTRQVETVVRRQLSAQEIADLSDKYDPSHMSQDQYDAFLDELVEKGALTPADTTWLGYHGLQRLDVDMDKMFDSLAEGRLYSDGRGYVTSADNYIPGLDSLEEAGGDLFRWLEHMLARLSLGIDPSTREGSRQKEEALNALRDIVRRM